MSCRGQDRWCENEWINKILSKHAEHFPLCPFLMVLKAIFPSACTLTTVTLRFSFFFFFKLNSKTEKKIIYFITNNESLVKNSCKCYIFLLGKKTKKGRKENLTQLCRKTEWNVNAGDKKNHNIGLKRLHHTKFIYSLRGRRGGKGENLKGSDAAVDELTLWASAQWNPIPHSETNCSISDSLSFQFLSLLINS